MKTQRWMLWGGAGVALVAIAALGLAVAQNTTTNASADPASAPVAAMMKMFHGGPWGDRHEAARPAFTIAGDNATGRFVTFAKSGASGVANVDLVDSNSTHPLVASAQLAIPAGAAATGATQRGAYVVQDGAGDMLAVSDSPGAQIRAASVNGTSVTLVIPDGATIAAHDAVANWSPAGATITYASGQVANLVLSKNATLAQSGQTLTVTLGPQAHMDFGILPPRDAFERHHGGEFGPRGHEGFEGPRARR